jgi:hypothetical protein
LLADKPTYLICQEGFNKGAYWRDVVHNRGGRGELGVEQMLGHILQHLLRLEREIRTLKDLLLKCAQRLKDQGK